MTKHKSESQRYARKAIEQYELGNIAESKRLAKRVSWRTLFLAAMAEFNDDAFRCVWITDKIKQFNAD